MIPCVVGPRQASSDGFLFLGRVRGVDHQEMRQRSAHASKGPIVAASTL